MNTVIHTENGITITEIVDDAIILNDVQDFLDIIANSPSKNMIFHKENITPDFFDLKTRIAGEILQKASNYRIKIGIVGDFEKVKSKSLKDFIYESNATEEIVFKETVAEVIGILGKRKERS